MNLPKVSAYCSTYARPNLLEEAVESFLRQDYLGEKELVILNDYSNQKLIYEHPEIKIYNVDEKIIPLGKKFNENVKLCTGDIIFVWEDDDIYLSNKFTTTIDKMLNSGKKVFHTQKAYYEYQYGKIMKAIDYFGYDLLFHVNLAFYKDVFTKVGGYFENDNISLDIDSISRLFQKQNYISENIEDNEIFYIYRLDTTNNYHGTWLSGWNTEGSISNASIEYVNQNTEKIVSGEYVLKPHWKYDYEKLAKSIL